MYLIWQVRCSIISILTFQPEPTTSLIRLVFTNTSVSAVRELCLFPANGGGGYLLGQDVSFSPPRGS